MHRRLRAPQERKIALSVSVACLCVIGLVYSDALQQQYRARPPDRVEVPGVADIAKPFSFSYSAPRTPASRLFDVSAETLLAPDLSSAELANGDAGSVKYEDARSASSWLMTVGPAGRARPSILFYRGSLPTFERTRSANAYRNLWTSGAAQYLDTSFASLLDSVFKHGDDANQVPDLSRQRQGSRNPFTDAKEKADAEAAPSAAAAASPPAPPPARQTSTPDQSAGTTTAPTQQPSAGGGSPRSGPPEEPFLVLGDFSGTGVVEAKSASRLDDGTFAFLDGSRSFSVYVNPSAPELQRSFAIDDFNDDGIPDLLVTSRAALLGAVLIGDGQGNYQIADTFVTGYEPTVPVPGLMGDGFRDILTVNVRTGWVQTFRRSDSYRMVRGQAAIGFRPDFVARITQSESGMDCFMAAESGAEADVYQWQSDGMLVSSGWNLPQAPSISINKDFLQENALGNLQVYQVGSSASVMLTDSHGASFNVANFRVFPQIFLIVGDISKRDTLDVGVAFLLSTAPAK